MHATSFTYQTRIVDTAGNIGTTASQAITIDSTVPSITGDLAITVNNDRSVVLTTADFHAVDSNSTAGQLTFTVSNPTNGYVAFAGALGTPINSFTEADLEAGLVAFVHDGSKTTEATFKVSVSDGASSSAAATIHAIVPTISIVVRTPSGMNFQNEDTIAALGAGVLQPGNTSTAFTLVNIAANRDFVFDGTGFQWTNGVLTAGTIFVIHELTHDTQSPLVDFSGHIDALSFYSAAVAQASGDDSIFDALTSQWVINFVGAAGNDAFGSNNANDFFKASGGNDLFDGGFGFDRANYASLSGPIAAQLAAGIVTKYTDVTKTTVAGTDHLQSIELVTGTDFADTFDATGFSATSVNSGSTVTFNTDGTLNEFEGRGGNDVITGNGNTRISYLHATGPVIVNFTSWVSGQGASGTATGDASVGTDTFTGVSRVRGSYFDDVFNGSNNDPNTVETFEGRGGNDTINGAGGFDRAVYRSEDAGITVHMAAGKVVGGPNTGIDTLSSVESVIGTDFNDIYIATADPDPLYGSAVAFGAAGAANVGSNGTFNEFEGADGDDIITGNGNTRIAFYNAVAGVTVTFTSIGAGTSQSTASGDAAGVGIDTFSGVNSVRGSAFDDIIGPDAGNNVFDGQAGNDTLQGGGGNDTLIGGDGIDRALYIDATGPITVNMLAGTVSGAGVGNDTLSSVESIRGSAFADTYVATGYNGTIPIGSLPSTFNEFEGMAGNDVIVGFNTTISYLNATGPVTVNSTSWVAGQGASGTATGDASVGTDTFTGVQYIRGSSFADTMVGSNNLTGVEVFEGRGGNDFIDGGGGFDRAAYEFRTDDNVTSGIIVNLAAGTVIPVVAGDTSIGNDTLRSIESVRGTHFGDTFDATGFTASSINAGSAGVDGNGAALNEFEGLGGNDTIIGNGNTRISFINAADGVTVDLASPTPGVSGSTGIASGTASGDVADIGTDTIFGGVNNIIGSSFADTLFGSNNGTAIAETFDGGAGNDTINGRGGFDVAVYNNDAGTVLGINVTMAVATVTVTGDDSIGTDTLIEVESIRGTNFDDIYVATSFNGASSDIPSGTTFNEFEGMDGNDTITGNGNTRISYLNASAGVTVILSGSGSGTAQSTAAGDLANVGIDTFTGISAARGSNFNDTFIVAVDNTPIAIDGRNGSDTVNYSAYTTALTVTITGGTPTIVHGSGSDDAHSDTIFNVENFVGGTGADTVTGDGSNNTYFATVDNVRDVFDGGAGSDTANYSAYSAALTVVLNGSTPTVVQGSGSDDAHSDTIVNVENFVGGTGADIVTGDASNNTYSATVDNVRDIFDGGAGNDTADYSAYAAALSVTLTGSTPAIVHGSGLDDAHSDTIANVENVIGGSGNDLFVGDANNNTFNGGAGFDQVSYQNAAGPISVNLAAGSVSGGASVGTDTLRSIEYVFGTNASDTL